MRARKVLPATLLAAAAASVSSEPKPLNRSIYVPVEFLLCEHLEEAVFYQDGDPVSGMPARRVFQFTYYPDLARLLPEVVQVRVEGAYVDDGGPFVARLAVTPGGVHTARSTRALDTEEMIHKQRHKIDVRLPPRTLRFACERFCRSRQVEGQ